MTDAELEELKAGLAKLPTGPWKSSPWHVEEGPPGVYVAEGWLLCATPGDDYSAHIARCSPDKIAALIARLEAAEGELRRISRWERYGGEDSAPIVYPKDIALAYFARLSAPPSKREG